MATKKGLTVIDRLVATGSESYAHNSTAQEQSHEVHVCYSVAVFP